MPKTLFEGRSIQLHYGLQTVLDIDHIEIMDGERIGLVGENGAGKSSLLNIISGESESTSGSIWRSGEIAFIRQQGDADIANGTDVQSRFRAQGARAHLSGGEQTRNRIAAALSSRAPLLLADEPTTDLDEEGVRQLCEALRRYRGAVVLVSHDRDLLDALCTRIWHLEDGKVTNFSGSYSDYLIELQNRRAYAQFEYDQYRQEQARLRASMQRVGERTAQMRKTPKRMGNSEARLHKMDSRQISGQLHKAKRQLESRLERLEAKERPREDVSIRMALGASHPVPAKICLEIRHMALNAGDKPLLRDASLALPTGSRTVLTGPNGCGKTTLLQTIARAAHLAPHLEGDCAAQCVFLHPTLKIGWFDQNHERTLDSSRSAVENVRMDSNCSESDARTVLARMALRGDAALKPVSALSGGER
ncbi:MAG: ABC-F family ATP-binding cassette domain-containing protein, partial [Clostridia bacterium]|nr:ABC-F family ATP-binding cassette domain-containing protein [Clostridia bacterium]